MEASLSATMNEDSEEELKPQTPPAKKRKVVEKTVVRVRIGAEFGKEKNEGPPSDSWSWRKYGQKPIKGSPHPRGYYRCSTAKGCSAKKQVERCKSDASVLIVTYTSSHNHPEGIRGVPRIPKQTRQQESPPESREEPQEQEEEPSAQDQEAQPTMEPEEFHYSQDLHEGELFTVSQTDTAGNNGSLGLVLLEQESLHVLPMERCSNNSSSELIPTMKPTEAEVEDDEYYDFFDELEELHPTISLLSYGFQEHHQLVGRKDSSCPV